LATRKTSEDLKKALIRENLNGWLLLWLTDDKRGTDSRSLARRKIDIDMATKQTRSLSVLVQKPPRAKIITTSEIKDFRHGSSVKIPRKSNRNRGNPKNPLVRAKTIRSSNKKTINRTSRRTECISGKIKGRRSLKKP